MHPPSEFDPVRCKDGKDDADGRNGHGNGHAGSGEDIGEDIGCTGVEVEDSRSGRVEVADEEVELPQSPASSDVQASPGTPRAPVDLGSLATTCFRLTPFSKYHVKVLLTA